MMKSYSKRRASGFTLVELILVLAVISTIFGLIINYSTNRMTQYRRDRAAMQMQQILAAGMGYYITHGQWPTSLLTMQTAGYLPTNLNSPWGPSSPYTTSSSASAANFTVSLTVGQAVDAQIIAGELPLASVTSTTVTGQVTVPGQNLNNARSVNYAGVFPNGSCVPVPTCPTGMIASIYVAPASVNGVNDVPSCSNSTTPSSCSNVAVYPLSSFSAYAEGPGSIPPVCGGSTSSGNLVSCTPNINTPNAPDPATTTYWRVCLNVITEKGVVSPLSASNQEALVGSIVAITRCVPGGGDIPNGNAF